MTDNQDRFTTDRIEVEVRYDEHCDEWYARAKHRFIVRGQAVEAGTIIVRFREKETVLAVCAQMKLVVTFKERGS